MALIEFKDLPDTSTPLNAENLNNNFNVLKEETETNINAIIENINRAKTISLSGQWLYGFVVSGGGTRVRLPIFNPSSGIPSINLTGQAFLSSGWTDVSNIQVSSTGTTFVEIAMETGSSESQVLLRLEGTIQAE